jgi:predicted CopG family antitoxin
MSVKTVTLAEDAYLALAARKREGESFSAVERRLTQTDRSLREFVGAWEDVPAEKLAKFEEWMEQSN